MGQYSNAIIILFDCALVCLSPATCCHWSKFDESHLIQLVQILRKEGDQILTCLALIHFAKPFCFIISGFFCSVWYSVHTVNKCNFGKWIYFTLCVLSLRLVLVFIKQLKSCIFQMAYWHQKKSLRFYSANAIVSCLGRVVRVFMSSFLKPGQLKQPQFQTFTPFSLVQIRLYSSIIAK